MSFVIVAITFTGLVTGALSRAQSDSRDLPFMGCLEEKNITNDEFQRLHANRDPAYGCIFACFFEKMQILQDGVFDRTKTIGTFKNMTLNNSKGIDEAKLSEMVDSCLNEAKHATNTCELSLSFADCMKRNADNWVQRENDNQG